MCNPRNGSRAFAAAQWAVITILLVNVAGCGKWQSPQPPIDAGGSLVTALAGNWNNAAQFADAPNALKVPPSVNGDWLDLQHAAFTPIEAPAIGERVLYLEWRNGGPDGAISRQRIWSFRTDTTGATRMDFFAFVDGKPWAGRATEAGAFRVPPSQPYRFKRVP